MFLNCETNFRNYHFVLCTIKYLADANTYSYEIIEEETGEELISKNKTAFKQRKDQHILIQGNH